MAAGGATHGSFVVACGAVSSGLPRPPARSASAHCEARRAPLPACASAARASQVIDGCRRAPNGTQAQSQTRVACFSLICPRDCASKARAQTLALRSAALPRRCRRRATWLRTPWSVGCGVTAEPHRQAHRRCTKRAHHRQNTASCSVFARPAVAVESGGRGPGCAHTRQSRGPGVACRPDCQRAGRGHRLCDGFRGGADTLESSEGARREWDRGAEDCTGTPWVGRARSTACEQTDNGKRASSSKEGRRRRKGARTATKWWEGSA
ncbi:hypothetical protein ERJ75_001548400 [Trypanosoma vivax]|nr:hypothetical protein ERJ75_001548400 [Trypanosoma vivax]